MDIIVSNNIKYAINELKDTGYWIIGFENSIILNKNIFIEELNDSGLMKPSWMACVRREPMYTEFKIHGNLIILMEPLATEDQNDTRKFLDKAASSIK